MTTQPVREPLFAGFLASVGVIGLIASLALSIEKVEKLQNPNANVGCDLSVLVQCSANLDSAQGAVLGFPNPFLGLIGFSLVLCAGVTLWAAPNLARWYWAVFNIGVAAAFAFALWLIGQSIYVLGTLCPWCMVVWVITIPLFVFTTGRNARTGIFGLQTARLGQRLWPWLTLITIVAYMIIATIAQVRLNVLATLL